MLGRAPLVGRLFRQRFSARRIMMLFLFQSSATGEPPSLSPYRVGVADIRRIYASGPLKLWRDQPQIVALPCIRVGATGRSA